MNTTLAVLLCSIVAVFAILFGHVFNWETSPLGRKLSLIERYIYGTLCIVTTPLLIMTFNGMLEAASLLAASVFFAGVATAGAYAYDAYRETYHRNMDLQDKLNYAETRHSIKTDVGD